MSKIRYSIATNWDVGLLDKLKGTSVESLYGQMWDDPLGGGRMSLFIPKIGKTDVTRFIAEAKKKGLSFNYLINATCFDNMEFNKEGYKKIREHLSWIASTGAGMVTVALPFFVQIIKKDFPELKVAASSFARIQNVHLARYWEDLGTDKIILPESINRDFQMLSSIRKAVNCELELIANHCCLFQCPLDLHHRNMVSHGSQKDHPCGGFAPDYCKLSCQRLKLYHPAELIKSRWIRPEDVSEYEALGIDCLKLVERFRETNSFLKIIHAYEQRHFEGNLIELLGLPQRGVYFSPNMELIERSRLVNVEKMKEAMTVLGEPFSEKIVLDNKKLNGFLDFFKKVDCFHQDCETCRYCERTASKAMTIDEKWRKEMVARFDQAIDTLTTGKLAGL